MRLEVCEACVDEIRGRQIALNRDQPARSDAFYVVVALRVRDTDADGLSDFAEIHKYGTDPKKADSDQDGIDDGDWRERREYTYTVRSVVQVMKPVTIEYLNDDYQDDSEMAGEKKKKGESYAGLDKETREAMARGDKWAKEHRSG